MRSDRRHGVLLFAAAGLGLLSACGQMGVKLPEPRTLKFSTGSEGCMNNLGDKLNRYTEGTLREDEWESVWSCAENTFSTFRKFVKGSGADGFSTDDIHALLSGFLITNRTVDGAFVDELFRMKSAFLGGDEQVLRYDEVDKVLSVMDWGKKWSTRIMPYFASRRAPFSVDDLQQMHDLFEQGAAELTAILPQAGDLTFTWDELEAFKGQFEELSGYSIPEWVMPAAKFAKRLWLGGSDAGFEARLIADVIQDFGDVASALLWLRSFGDQPFQNAILTKDVLLDVAENLKPLLNRVLDRHGGSLSLSFADEALDWVPDSIITGPRGKVADRDVIRKAFRTVNWRVFRSERQEEFNQVALDRIFYLAERYVRSDAILEQIYSNLGAPVEGVKLPLLTDAADRYRKSLVAAGAPQADLDRVDWVVSVISKFKPLFRGEETLAYFDTWDLYSLGGVRKMVLMRLVSEELIPAYSTDANHDRVSLEDIRTFASEFIPLLAEFQMADVAFHQFPDRRYIEGNLFTPMSNGDKAIDLDEFTHYGALLLSIAGQTESWEDQVNELCGLGPDQIDPYGYQWMDPKCFRREFFGRLDEIWVNSPHLLAWWKTLSTKDKAKAATVIEQATRKYGVTELPLGNFDAQSFIGITHYLEEIFARYDLNRDEVIRLDELMGAYPVFKQQLADFGHIDINNNTLLEAAFTYVVRYGFPPTSDLWGTAHFIGWLAWKPFWRIKASRMELLKVLAALNPAEAPPADGGGTLSVDLEQDCTTDAQEWELTGRCYFDPAAEFSPGDREFGGAEEASAQD